MRRPSFPTVISLIALFVALGGTSYAVIKLPAKSVGNRELKTNAVTSAKIRAGAVSRSDLSLGARSGTRGPRGPAGPAGSPGDAAAPEAWKPLPFVGAWTNYGHVWAAPAYRKDQRGRVYLRGLAAKNPGAPAGDDPIALLPPGYRPTARLIFAVASGSQTAGQLYGRVDVLPDGNIYWVSGAGGEGDFTSLSTISFWSD
jgi:hypothetical protein